MRSIALVAVALFVSARTASIVHELTVTHVTCAEHGELVHAEDIAGTHSDVDVAHVAATQAQDAHHGDHDHCLIAVLAESHATVSKSSTLAMRHAPQLKLPNPAAPPAPTARHLQRLAPKTSPPVTQKA